MRLQGTTIEVRSLSESTDFYENVLGFEPGEFYESTKWQPYRVGGQYFAIREVDHRAPRDDFDITNFEVDDVDGMWDKVKGSAVVVEALRTTPYGTYKFVVADPDGYRLGFVGKKTG
jgi:catechol 2,3-dioxygenase-like lactoylglutathione lyase family enzyme